MIDLFNLGVAYMSYPSIALMYANLPKTDTPGKVHSYPGFKNICGEHYNLILMDSGQIYFNYKGESLHINQYPLYERYNQFLERGV